MCLAGISSCIFGVLILISSIFIILHKTERVRFLKNISIKSIFKVLGRTALGVILVYFGSDLLYVNYKQLHDFGLLQTLEEFDVAEQARIANHSKFDSNVTHTMSSNFDAWYTQHTAIALNGALIISGMIALVGVLWLINVFTKSLSYPDNMSIPTKSNQEIETEQHNFLIKHVVLLFRIRLLVVTFVALAIGYYLWHLFDIISNSAHSNIAAMLLLKQNLLTKPNASSDNIQTIINNKDKLKNFYYLTEKEFIATITLTIFAISGLAVLIKMFLSPMSLGTKQNDSDNKAPNYARITGKINNDIPTNDTMSALNSFVQSVTRSDNNHEKESKL